LLDEHDIDVVGLTETRGRDDIMDTEFDFASFKLFRKDRSMMNYKKGGGVTLYVRDSLLSMPCDDLNSKHCESIWTKVYVNEIDYFIARVCYKSPDADEKEIDELFNCFKEATDLNQSIIIMGDFNYRTTDWKQLKADDVRGQKFIKLTMDCF